MRTLFGSETGAVSTPSDSSIVMPDYFRKSYEALRDNLPPEVSFPKLMKYMLSVQVNLTRL
jgi:hypothetical protein